MRKCSVVPPASFLTLLFVSTVLLAQHQETPPSSASAPILGFTPPHAVLEHKLETEFQAVPSPEKTREWHRTLTAEPQPGATERNNQLADYLANYRRKQGRGDGKLRRY